MSKPAVKLIVAILDLNTIGGLCEWQEPVIPPVIPPDLLSLFLQGCAVSKEVTPHPRAIEPAFEARPNARFPRAYKTESFQIRHTRTCGQNNLQSRCEVRQKAQVAIAGRVGPFLRAQ